MGKSFRKTHGTGFHLGWGGIVAAFFIAAASTAPFVWPLGLGFGVLFIVLSASWAWLSGWRLQSPVRRLPQPKVRTPAEEAVIAETRRVKDALTELLHARARPAVSQVSLIFAALADDLKAQAEPSYTLGQLAALYPLKDMEHAESKVRRALEGSLWDEPKHADLNRFSREMDLEKQTAESLALDFYFYFTDYVLLSRWANRFASLVGIERATDPRFTEWSKLHEQFVDRLRDVLALPGVGSIRDDFAKRMTEWTV